MSKDNWQYGYTSKNQVYESINDHPNWIQVKLGQSIEQNVNSRINQQDISSTTNPLIKTHELCVENNSDTKLDDKIRAYLLEEDFKIFEIGNRSDGKSREYIKVFIGDFFKKSKTKKIHKNILEDLDFLNFLGQRIMNAQKIAVKKLTGKTPITPKILRPWQKDTLDKIIKENKDHILLSLCPRFGKTLLVLELVKHYVKTSNDKIVLIVASKNLSSNTSFQNEYDLCGYDQGDFPFKIISDTSLFVDESQIMQRLKNKIPRNHKVILVTDEADQASHTTISRDKLNLICKKYNIIKQIAMTGTGIYKAAKIFKNIEEKNICFVSLNYTELSQYKEKFVKRNFFNVQYDITAPKEELKNIQQSMEDTSCYDDLSGYVNNFVSAKRYINRYGLQDTNVVMVFINTQNNKDLKNFFDFYKEKYPENEYLLLKGGKNETTLKTTNANAEKQTTNKIKNMNKNKNKNKLVIFSRGMAQRSYTVPEIGRVLVLKDGPLTGSDYQKFSRCLTFTKGKVDADIVRISFSGLDLPSELFMLENGLSITEKDQGRARYFLDNNTFFSIVMNINKGKITVKDDANIVKTPLQLIDKAMKFMNTTKCYRVKLYDQGIDVAGVVLEKTIKTKTSTLKTPGKSKTETKIGKKTKEKIKEDELLLDRYIEFMRSMPCIAYQNNIKTVKGFLNSNLLKDVYQIPRESFLNNCRNENFKLLLDQSFRNFDPKNTEGDLLNLLENL